jgi:hypothetical protein
VHREFGGDLGTTSNHQLNEVAQRLLGTEYRGAVDARSVPEDDGKTQYVIVNSAVAPASGHWVAFVRHAGNLYYYDSYSRPLDHYFKWGHVAHTQADPVDREQRSKALGNAAEDENCGILALTWLMLVKTHGLAVAMRV